MHATKPQSFQLSVPRTPFDGNFLLPSTPLPFRLDTVRQTLYDLQTTASAVVTWKR